MILERVFDLSMGVLGYDGEVREGNVKGLQIQNEKVSKCERGQRERRENQICSQFD